MLITCTLFLPKVTNDDGPIFLLCQESDTWFLNPKSVHTWILEVIKKRIMGTITWSTERVK